MDCSDENSCSGNNNASETNNAVTFFEATYDSCLIVLAIFIIAINVLVPALFIRNRGLRTKTNILLVSLAIADLIMGLIGIPMYISCNALAWYPEYIGMCITAAVVYRFIAVSTIFHIFAITLERYISVRYPFSYVTLVKMSRLSVVIASIWIGSLLMALVQLSWQDVTRGYVQQSLDSMAYKAGLVYNIVGVFFCFLIPFAIMIFIYWRMFMIIRTQIKRIKEQNVTGFEENCKPLASERKAITIFALMLGVFMVCWLTWYMSLVSNYVEIFHVAVPEVVHNLFDFLRFSTSLINPLLYTFLKSDFRKAFCCLIRSKCGGRLKQDKGLRSENGLTTIIRYNNDEDSDETKKLTLQ